MAQKYLDRYNRFKSDDNYKPVPGIKISEKNSDKFLTYKGGRTRFDILSQKYYDSPYYGWLIMLANPEFGGLEFNIPNNKTIRIPFPLTASINDYIEEVDKYFKLYG
jgi:hypothetical protein|tara:strand:- start:211 stop:531 length:321 start_codon:yes stop_codon:yes gene_type:complete